MTDARPALLRPGRRFRNWSGSVDFTPSRCAQPASSEEVQALVRHAAEARTTVRVRGSGHSFVPLLETDGVLLDLDRLSGVEAFGERTATIWAGSKLDMLGRALSERGLGMRNLGDINKQSLGGAVGTGTHGTGLTLGSLSAQVEALSIVLASGELVECSVHENPELFTAARVALGSLGIITRLRVAVEPAYKLKLNKYTMDLDACLEQAGELARAHRHFEFYWFPHTRVVGVKTMDPTAEPESARAFNKLGELVLENGTFGLISRAARLHPAWAPGLSRLTAWFMKGDTGTMVADCHRAFSSVRLVHFHEMEYLLPAESGPEALRALAAFVEREQVLVHFPVEYRYVRGDDIWLSPCHQRDSVAISVHQYVGMDHDRYFKGAEAIFRSFGGRPHWGKMHNLGAAELASLYPRWHDFQRLRRQLDPHGLFRNAFTTRLFGE